MPDYKLGKLPARTNSVILRLGTYLDRAVFPTVPETVGSPDLVPDWGMLANDRVGNAVWAGAAHEVMLFDAEVGRTVAFNDAAVLLDYSAATGYDPADPNTDRGTDLQKAASYRQRTGVLDANGVRHKVGAYLSITPGDPHELAAAVYIFGSVGVGLRFPAYAMDQFDAGETWDTRYGNPDIAGGHYVPVVGRHSGLFDLVCWGRLHTMSEKFYRRYCDEAVVYLSEEFVSATSESPEGFDLPRLRADLKAFRRP